MNVNIVHHACLGADTIRTIRDIETGQSAVVTQEQEEAIIQNGVIPQGLEWSSKPPNCPVSRFNGQVLEVEDAGSNQKTAKTKQDSPEKSIPNPASKDDSRLVKDHPLKGVIREDKEKIQREHKPHHAEPVAKGTP